ALDGVGDEADGLIGRRSGEGLEDQLEIMAAEIGHEPGELGVVMTLDDGERIRVGRQVPAQLLTPRRATLKDERRIELVRAVVDPAPDLPAAGLSENALEQLAVLEQHHLPAEVLEEAGDLHEQPVGYDAVEALAVVVDHPPGVAEAMLPVLEQ